jgi:hypothetical protein
MILRWSIWGRSIDDDLPMLRDSIRSFRKHIGCQAKYLVYTDTPDIVKSFLGGVAEVRSYFSHPNVKFRYFGKATWGKWCPSARLAPGDIEIHIDADVFLLRPPIEINSWVRDNPGNTFLVLSEAIGTSWQRGIFAEIIEQDMPFINAGFFAQGPDADISKVLEEQYSLWRAHFEYGMETFHDEQGALTKALVAEHNHGRLKLLPKDRYIIASTRSNSDLDDPSGIVLFHATHPSHPFYHKFRKFLV